MYIYYDRELSNIDFIHRVLAIAKNSKVPIVERYRYICICCSLLDEFFEIRFSSVIEELRNSKQPKNIENKISSIQSRTKHLEKNIQNLLFQTIIPELRKHDIFIFIDNNWDKHYQIYLNNLFKQKIKPFLHILVIDKNRPFPKIINKSTAYYVELEERESAKSHFAVIQLPRNFQRVYEIPKQISGAGKHAFVFMVALMREFAESLFPDFKFINFYQFKVTRNSDLLISEEDMADLRATISGKLKTRQMGEPVRIELSTRAPKKVQIRLAELHGISLEYIHRFRGTPSLANYIGLLDKVKNKDYFFESFKPKKINYGKDIFEWIEKEDRLLHHPYQSFDTINDLVRLASTDPDVVSIKQTIYRAGKKSKLLDYLMDASVRGKEVTALIELQARFDEEANISWAKKLEDVGAHIIHGKANFKCHAKLLLITKYSQDPKTKKMRIKSFAHLGTGNYNETNSKTYTDFGLLTSDKRITKEVEEIFDYLCGAKRNIKVNHLWYSPDSHYKNIKRLINYEIRQAQQNKQASMILKLNALTDERVIDMLYKASNAGVKVDLIVRGTSKLIPGIKKQSENIILISTVGKYLEHHRVLYFNHGGEELVYCSSADWMERNLTRRTEVTFPIWNKLLKKRIIKEALQPHLDSKHSYWLTKNLKYKILNKSGNKLHPNEITANLIQKDS